jgi:flagellar assembly protein FliH
MSLLSEIIRDKKKIKETDVNRIFSVHSKPLIMEEKKQGPMMADRLTMGKDIFSEDKARKLKEEVVTAAKDEAEKLLSDVNTRIDEIKQKGYDDGFKKGYEEGLIKVDKEMKNILSKLESIAIQALEEKNKAVLQAEPQIIELSIELAKKILEFEVQTDPTVVVKIAKRAIRKVVEAEKARLRVNPGDLEEVKSHFGEITASGGIITKIDVMPDPKIQLGGCVIDFDNGSIDAQLKTQIEEYGKSLRSGNV